MFDKSLARIKPTQEEIDKILELHRTWLYTEGKEGKQAVFNQVDLYYIDFSGMILCGVRFIDSIIRLTRFNKSHLEDVTFTDCRIENSKFTEALLDELLLNRTEIYNTCFADTDINNSTVCNSLVEYSRLTGSMFDNVAISESTVHDCTLNNAVLFKTVFKDVDKYQLDFETLTIIKSQL